MKKLIAVEEIVTQETLDMLAENPWKLGDMYIVLMDPETGRFYEPKEGWTVEGEDLLELFTDVSVD